MAEDKKRAAGAAVETKDDWEEESKHCMSCPVVGLMTGAKEIFQSRMMDRLPEEFVKHAVGARREFLLAIRSLVDGALESQERHLDDYKERKAEREQKERGPQKVAVE